MSRLVGRSVSIEDLGLYVDGTARYLADLDVRACLELAFVRSHAGHGVLRDIDVSSATTVNGVVGVYTARDLASLPAVPPSPGNEAFSEGYPRPSLASERVRYAGEPIAAVLGETRQSAIDGTYHVFASIEQLPIASFSVNESDQPSLFDSRPNLVYDKIIGATEIDAVIAESDVIVERSDVIPRLAHLSLETRRILVDPTTNPITVWSSTQAPHRLRAALLEAFPSIADRGVRVRVPPVGGAFGLKSHVYPEYLVAFALALETGRAVRWAESRREGLMGGAHGRGQMQRIRIGANREGRIRGIERDIVGDLGAYPHHGAYVPHFTALVGSGPYSVDCLSIRVRAVLTNRAPTCPYRGAGRPEAAFVLERAIDDLAHRIGRDPAEVRRTNFVPSSEFPYESPTGAVYDSGDYEALLDRALELADYASVRKRQKRPRNEDSVIGIGIGAFVERSGGAVGASEFASVQIKNHKVICRSGSISAGQEHITTFTQIVADALELPPEAIEIIEGDTEEVPDGTGTFASRSLQVGGSALYLAAQRVRDEVVQRAANKLEISPEDLEYKNGCVIPAGSADLITSIWDLVSDSEPLLIDHTFASDQAFPSGVYVAVVRIDIETGDVDVSRIVAVDDCGVVVNPRIVDGQVMGSSMQGLGGALTEEIAYDGTAQLLTSSLMDYLPPKATTSPELITASLVTHTYVSPTGAKGAGEAGCIGVPAAIINAIQDGIRIGGGEGSVSIPATAEKVWRAMNKKGPR